MILPIRRSIASQQRGFTLIELVVTVAILGLLASISFPLLELTEQRGKEKQLRESLRQIRTGLDQYKRAVDEGRIIEATRGSGYPPNLSILVAGVPDAKSPNRDQKIYFLRKLPRDPMAPNGGPDELAESTWGLRSYASPPDAPAPGADVFDVYSLSPRSGLNGSPYRNW
jgi:general secretion pathway protein G